MEKNTRKNHLWLAGILSITFIVFLPAIRNMFIAYDDIQYVIENPFITSVSANNLKTILLEDANNLGNYHPLTLLSYLVNYSFSGLNPTAYHLTNVLIHLFNTFLVFQLALLLFARLGSDHRPLLSSITALLFGIHPLHVESVAWVSGRKDLLYTCFYLLSLLSYIRYLDKKTTKYYLYSLGFFILSLLSKGMAVTLSLSVVALDYLFKRDLLKRAVILEKIPFFILSVLFGITAMIVQKAQGATDIIKYNFPERIIFASYGFTQYLVKLVFPYKLCGYYPYPDIPSGNIPGVYYLSLLPALFTVLLLFYFILFRPRRTIVFGGLFFIINVMLVIQLFPVGSAVMADRYTYLSSFGLFFLMASGFGFIIQKFNRSGTLISGVFIIYVFVLSVISYQRCTVWRDSYSFWEDVMKKFPSFYPAINNLGLLYDKEGKTQEAFQFFTNSIQVCQHNPEAYLNRGIIYGKSGQFQEAIADFDQAIRYSPGLYKAYINRGIAKAMNRDNRGALADLDQVLDKEKNEEAYLNRGILRYKMKEYTLAIPDLQEAILLNPSCNYAYYFRALSYIESGKPDSSCIDLQKAFNSGIKEAEPYLKQFCHK